MKRLCPVVLCVLFIFGCAGKKAAEDGLSLRNRLLSGNGCEFDVAVTADYGKELYAFSMHCKADEAGELTFSVSAPESIAGIAGTVSSVGGKLTFDNHALAFPVLAEGQISPVSAPWFFITALRGGFLKVCEEMNDGFHLVINDSYGEDALQIDIFTEADLNPIQADILWQSRRILTLTIENFRIL